MTEVREPAFKERYLRVLQDPWYRDIVKLQDAITRSTTNFFAKRRMSTLHLPVTTGSISSPMGLGSDSSPVQVDLFGVKTYLADSMQFMLEYGCRLHDDGVWYLMPSFRGEAADERHLCQFYHAEAEIPGTLADVMSLVEDYLREMTRDILRDCAPIIQRHARDVSHVMRLINSDGPRRVTVDEACSILGNDPRFVRQHELGFRTLSPLGERSLLERYNGFVWVYEPDHLSVPFYQAFADSEGKKALAADLLFGIGEVVGCGERHPTHVGVERALAQHGVEREAYEWYVRMREEFPLQTAGFGMGVERFLCWLLKHDDIRDFQILPRNNGVETIP